MNQPLSPAALAQLFTGAHTHRHWQDQPVDDALLAQLFDLMKMAPTSANCSPARLVFVKSEAAKALLKPALIEGNVVQTMNAPVTAIVAADQAFYEQLPRLYPHADARSWFLGNEALIAETAFRNASLQGAYLIMAARALGLDCGPMSGFDAERVNQAFFAGTAIKANFLVNLGYGVPEKLHARGPRFAFAEVCSIR